MSRKKKSFPFFLWHRRLGLLALLLVFVLSITGIMLNHTEALKLDERSVDSNLLMDWYGINPQGNAVKFSSDNHWLGHWDQQLFLNGERLQTSATAVHGMVETADMLAIALERQLLLIDFDGEVIELMPMPQQAAISRIGLSETRLALLDKNGQFYLADKYISQLHTQAAQATRWSSAENIEDEQLEQIKLAYRGKGLSLERLILDLHSGRLFHPVWGVYLMDASAIIMMFLGVSGIWVWWSRKLKMRRKKHYRKHH